MKYINVSKGTSMIFIILIILSFIIKGKGPSSNIELLLTIATFLFAILAGFFISRAGSRFDKVRELLSNEDALFLSLYKTSEALGKTFSKKMGDLIDKYYIISYDNEISEYGYLGYKKTLNCFMQMWDTLTQLKIKSPNAYHQNIADILLNIETNRNAASAIAKENISRGQWVILTLLSAIIIFCLFYIKTNELYSIIITILLTTSLFTILLLLRDLINLRFGCQGNPIEESGQEVLECMGKLRYYNKQFLNMEYNSIPKNIKTYRLGLHKPGNKFDIKIIKVNPQSP